jgi:hypothetical protein
MKQRHNVSFDKEEQIISDSVPWKQELLQSADMLAKKLPKSDGLNDQLFSLRGMSRSALMQFAN